MKKFKYLLMVVAAIMAAGMITSCGGDDEPKKDDPDDDMELLYGTWYSGKNTGLDEVTIDRKRVSGVWRMDSGRPVSFDGTYVLEDDKMDLWISFEGDSEREHCMARIMSVTRTTLELVINYDGESEYYTLKRDKDDDDPVVKPDDPDDPEANIYGTWRGVRPSWDNEYVYSITFNRDGGLYGRFLEGDGDMSDFTGYYTYSGNRLNLTLIYEDEYEQDIDTYEGTVIRLTADDLWYQIEDEDGEKYIYKFTRD